jgi:Flp pilus assembly protein TadD
MYYPITTKLADKRIRFITSFLVFAISFFTLLVPTHAEIKNSTAEEYRIRGYDEQQKGNYKHALTYYSKAISLGLNNAIIYNDIGVVYEQLGTKDKAEVYYLKAIEQSQDYLPPYTNLAFLYEDQGAVDKAVYYFEKRLERGQEDDPWQERVRNELYKIDPSYKARLIRQEASDLNKVLVKKAQNEFSLQIERAEKHYQKGKLLLTESNYEQAIAEFDRALTLTPDSPKIIKARELALYEENLADIKGRVAEAMEKIDAGDLESAKKEFQKILTLIPSAPIPSSEE